MVTAMDEYSIMEKKIEYPINVSGIIKLDEMLYKGDQFESVWMLMANN